MNPEMNGVEAEKRQENGHEKVDYDVQEKIDYVFKEGNSPYGFGTKDEREFSFHMVDLGSYHSNYCLLIINVPFCLHG